MKVFTQRNQNENVSIIDIGGMNIFVDVDNDNFLVCAGSREETQFREKLSDYLPMRLGAYKTKERAEEIIYKIAIAIEEGKSVFYMP